MAKGRRGGLYFRERGVYRRKRRLDFDEGRKRATDNIFNELWDTPKLIKITRKAAECGLEKKNSKKKKRKTGRLSCAA